MITIISTDKAPSAIGPYSQAVKTNDMLYTSGQIPIDPTSGKVTDGNITAQTKLVMENLKAVLEEADYKLENVVKTTCFLTDMEDFVAFNEVYGNYFKLDSPARSCVAVKTLPKNVLVEVEAIAVY